jgi:hypothetical protein
MSEKVFVSERMDVEQLERTVDSYLVTGLEKLTIISTACCGAETEYVNIYDLVIINSDGDDQDRLAEKCLQAGVTPNQPHPVTGRTILMDMVCENQVSTVARIVKHCVKAGVSLDHRWKSAWHRRGQTAYEMAIALQHYDCGSIIRANWHAKGIYRDVITSSNSSDSYETSESE